MFSGPGPAKYQLPSVMGTGSGWSMAQRLKDLTQAERSPGPASYALPKGQCVTGTYEGPKYELGIRHKHLNTESLATPGPKYPSFDPAITKEPRAASYTMRSAIKDLKANSQVPGPNNYVLPGLLGPKIVQSQLGGGKDWSMTGRSNVGSFTQVFVDTPGPAGYGPNLGNARGRSQPAYTMRSRAYMPLVGTQTPGPAYDIRKTAEAKGGTFGIRHSPFAYVRSEADV